MYEYRMYKSANATGACSACHYRVREFKFTSVTDRKIDVCNDVAALPQSVIV